MNSYPLLDNKLHPIFTTDLDDITPQVRSQRVIDISDSPLAAAYSLRRKLQRLHDAGELDGGLPIVRHNVLVGLIAAPDLEFALDKLDDEEHAQCLMATEISWSNGEEVEEHEHDPTDLTPYIDPVNKTDPFPYLTHVADKCSKGTRVLGRPLAHGSRLSMLRQAGLTLYLCAERWPVRGSNP